MYTLITPGKSIYVSML